MKKSAPLFIVAATLLTACPGVFKDSVAPSKPVLGLSKFTSTPIKDIRTAAAPISVASGETFRAIITNIADNVGVTSARIVKVAGQTREEVIKAATKGPAVEFDLKYDCPAGSPAEVTVSYAAQVFDADQNTAESDVQDVTVTCSAK
ncbi:MAG: hypothetical protein ACK41E_01285 [Deinococcales bacterium]